MSDESSNSSFGSPASDQSENGDGSLPGQQRFANPRFQATDLHDEGLHDDRRFGYELNNFSSFGVFPNGINRPPNERFLSFNLVPGEDSETSNNPFFADHFHRRKIERYAFAVEGMDEREADDHQKAEPFSLIQSPQVCLNSHHRVK